MGKEQIVTLNFMDNTVRAILNTDEVITPGNSIKIGLKEKGVFIFDEKNGERLM